MNLAVKLLLAGVLGFIPICAVAQEMKPSTVKIDAPWVRVIIPGRPATGYMKMLNSGAQADTLLSASSSMAERVELHSHNMKDGIMRMRRVKSIVVPAKGEIELKPGSLHFMIFGLSTIMKKGGKLPLSLVFEKAGTLKVEAEIMGLGKMKMGDHSGHGAKRQ